MTVFETLMIMIAFASLIVNVLSYRKITSEKEELITEDKTSNLSWKKNW